VLRLEQRRVAGQEPPSEQQPGYSEEFQVHLHRHRHRTPVSATQPSNLLVTDIPARRRAMNIQAILVPPPTLVLLGTAIRAPRTPRLFGCVGLLDTQAAQDSLLTPVHRAMDTKAARYRLPTLVPGL
jgi:hypothetical protein